MTKEEDDFNWQRAMAQSKEAILEMATNRGKEIIKLRDILKKIQKAATEKCSSWEFRSDDWRDGYIANGDMIASFIKTELRHEGRPMEPK